MNHPALRDAALLVLRIVVGVIFIAHGWDKAFVRGMEGPGGAIEQYKSAGAPGPEMMAWFVAAVEMFGGALLITGLLATAAAGVLAIVAAVNLYFLHLPHGFFAADGGMEVSLILIASSLTILVFGSGRASLDRALSRFV